MFRRAFLQGIGVGLTANATVHAREQKTVTYRVDGFSCVTCAAGLDTMLLRNRGVAKSKASYPDGITVITFDPNLISEKGLKALIAEMGFTAVERPTSAAPNLRKNAG